MPQPSRGFDEEAIINGWQSGEGFDYFYQNNNYNNKIPFTDPKYSWKNIRYWWENEHIDPDGQKTNWKPKMKPIWFTEYGFPSINGCSNQPNVFVDSTSIESNLPKYSNGNVDFKAQINATSGTLAKWDNSDMVSNMFLWTWDARPFPFFPAKESVWKDARSWQTGHWIQGKISVNKLGSVITDLLLKAGFSSEEFDTTQLNELVSGYLLLEQQTVKHAIEILQQAYFFDITEREGIIIFIPRKFRSPTPIKPQDQKIQY